MTISGLAHKREPTLVSFALFLQFSQQTVNSLRPGILPYWVPCRGHGIKQELNACWMNKYINGRMKKKPSLILRLSVQPHVHLCQINTPSVWLLTHVSLIVEKSPMGTSLAVQWLRLHASTAGGTGLISGLGTEIPHAEWSGQNKQTNRMKLKKKIKNKNHLWLSSAHRFKFLPSDSGLLVIWPYILFFWCYSSLFTATVLLM